MSLICSRVTTLYNRMTWTSYATEEGCEGLLRRIVTGEGESERQEGDKMRNEGQSVGGGGNTLKDLNMKYKAWHGTRGVVAV